MIFYQNVLFIESKKQSEQLQHYKSVFDERSALAIGKKNHFLINFANMALKKTQRNISVLSE